MHMPNPVLPSANYKWSLCGCLRVGYVYDPEYTPHCRKLIQEASLREHAAPMKGLYSLSQLPNAEMHNGKSYHFL